MWVRQCATLVVVALVACGGQAPVARPTSTARGALLITIDTLRADRVGAYGYAAARTPALDALARSGVRFQHAYATAPITLTSHASLLTGRYPPGHGARHNGIRILPDTPTLAEQVTRAGFVTAAFVAAFPLDRRFGLIKGFQTYGDRMPRGRDGRPASERPGRLVVDEALDWLARHRDERFFLWVHLFEPHAPYGNIANPTDARRPASARYDDEIAEADRQIGRLLDGLGDRRASTIVIAASDHGEAFGEHGEIAHSLFTYDTTLRVPLIFTGPDVPAARTVDDPVSLVDIAPTLLARLAVTAMDTDGIDLSPAFSGQPLQHRALYAESFAPLFDFGWNPLRTLRLDGWKYIAAPRAELYEVRADPDELHNVIDRERARAATLAARTDAIAGSDVPGDAHSPDAESLARLQSLGYASGRAAPASQRIDPKDRRELAARIAQVTSGELQGPALERALREILREDPHNPQANVRLGYVLLDRGRCADARPLLARAIENRLPGADAHLGIASCQVSARDLKGAEQTLRQAERVEPDNPVVIANLGNVLSDGGQPADALNYFQRALTLDPDLHQARFALAIAYARLGRRSDAAAQTTELLRRLRPDAPQRAEVERLHAAVQ